MFTNHDLLAAAFDKQQQAHKNSDASRQQTVANRAVELGMDPAQDTKLFWIAEQSLKAKIPEEWIECHTDEGQLYYYNLRNEDSTWEHPSLDHYRQLYEKVKKQQTESRGTKTNLPEIGSRDVTHESGQKTKESPRAVAAQALKQKKDAERLGGDVAFWRTRFEMMEAEVTPTLPLLFSWVTLCDRKTKSIIKFGNWSRIYSPISSRARDS
jgi:hypothetical protein